jgi:hypothetical protein
MNKKAITKTFTITTNNQETMDTFERFLCFLHYNGGHSGIFGMEFDGDGSDRLKVDPAPAKDSRGYNDFSIINTGQDMEIACSSCYKSFPIDQNKHYYKAKGRKLFKINRNDGTEELKKDYSNEDLSKYD